MALGQRAATRVGGVGGGGGAERERERQAQGERERDREGAIARLLLSLIDYIP